MNLAFRRMIVDKIALLQPFLPGREEPSRSDNSSFNSDSISVGEPTMLPDSRFTSISCLAIAKDASTMCIRPVKHIFQAVVI